MNPVLRFLQDLGKAKTNALSVIVTMRPDPATLRIVSDSPERSLQPDSCDALPSDSVAHTCDAMNLQLRYAYGTENTLEVAPSELRYAGPRADLPAQDCPAAAPNWAAAMQANERTKIFVTVCRGFVERWLASQPTATLPTPPVSLDAAYRLFFEHFQAHDDSVPT